jgi:hypothetical protein
MNIKLSALAPSPGRNLLLGTVQHPSEAVRELIDAGGTGTDVYLLALAEIVADLRYQVSELASRTS